MSTPTTTLTGTWIADTVHSDVSFKVRQWPSARPREHSPWIRPS